MLVSAALAIGFVCATNLRKSMAADSSCCPMNTEGDLEKVVVKVDQVLEGE